MLKKTGGTRSASTAVEVLEELALTHELPKLILEFRGLHKLKGTYVDALPLLAKERQRLIIALVKQIRWGLSESPADAAIDPEATIRLSS